MGMPIITGSTPLGTPKPGKGGPPEDSKEAINEC